MSRLHSGTAPRVMLGVLAGVVFAVIWLCIGVQVAYAQCGGDVAVGSTTQGEIWGGSCEYYFNGTAGDSMTIRMSAVSSSLDPFLELYSPQGGKLASDDDSGGGYNSLITYRLPSDGWYTIAAGAYSGSGSFSLTVSRGSTGGSSGGSGGAIQLPGQVRSQVANSGQRYRYTFSVGSPRTVTITMMKTSGNLDPYLELFGPNGALVASDDDSAGNYNSQIVRQLNGNSTYTIVARDYGSGTGSFELTVR